MGGYLFQMSDEDILEDLKKAVVEGDDDLAKKKAERKLLMQV
ncbi:MAG: hypothetical protein BTN85_0281 [Candidatus Methanohalarchaeum thermophilum]|uniref:Uncharacterized protein n=1 Tax=Methanohalarchaeum thermophilum TaxID=1903181 RepID=A0A1Q6DTV7_METT1|nr:MAG: hypothetical protein BTN85_0281 [Candidatus Methanohalarchaeum thermophilum]